MYPFNVNSSLNGTTNGKNKHGLCVWVCIVNYALVIACVGDDVYPCYI